MILGPYRVGYRLLLIVFIGLMSGCSQIWDRLQSDLGLKTPAASTSTLPTAAPNSQIQPPLIRDAATKQEPPQSSDSRAEDTQQPKRARTKPRSSAQAESQAPAVQPNRPAALSSQTQRSVVESERPSVRSNTIPLSPSTTPVLPPTPVIKPKRGTPIYDEEGNRIDTESAAVKRQITIVD